MSFYPLMYIYVKLPGPSQSFGGTCALHPPNLSEEPVPS
jgi:hypothetical protein